MKNIVAKKSLGQNFLHATHVIEKIVDVSQVFPGDVVVEVGPGEGALTNALLNAGAHVIAIEKDHRCIPLLTDRFDDAVEDRRLILIEGDVLEEKITQELFLILSEIPTYKVVANIPYYITGMLFRFFLEEHRQPSQLTFLVQKEVAEQIVAHDKKESVLSLSVKIFGDPHYAGKVGKECFRPAPKVDSAILTITHINDARLCGVSREDFFRVVKAGFRARRKMLAGNLAEHLELPREKILSLFEQIGINPKTRGEDLPVETWVSLAKNILTQPQS